MKHTRTLVLYLAAVFALAGCASGPGFRAIPNSEIPPNKALVYIFRPVSIRGSGLVPTVDATGLEGLRLRAGGYFPLFVPAGMTWAAITQTGRFTVEFDAKAGETYYVRGGPIAFALGIPYIQVATRESALPELQECKLLPAPGESEH
jgi:hypothetical protein